MSHPVYLSHRVASFDHLSQWMSQVQFSKNGYHEETMRATFQARRPACELILAAALSLYHQGSLGKRLKFCPNVIRYRTPRIARTSSTCSVNGIFDPAIDLFSETETFVRLA